MSLTQKLEPKWLEAVAEEPQFLPEIARRLGDPVFTRHIQSVDRRRLMEFFKRPKEFLLELISNLDAGSRAALGLIHLRGGKLESPFTPASGDQDFLARVGATQSDVMSALGILEGSLLRLSSVGNERWWEFHHPSLTDAFREWLASQPEMLAEYVDSTPADQLVQSITCGDMKLTNAIVVPHPLFDKVIDRISLLGKPDDTRIWSFLLSRSDGEFLRKYVTLHPNIVDKVFSIGIYLETFGLHRDLGLRLLDEGLCSESHRINVVTKLFAYAIDGEDGSFLTDDRWLRFFTPSELQVLDEQVKRQTLPELGNIVEAILDAYDRGQAPFDTIRDSVGAYEARYGSLENEQMFVEIFESISYHEENQHYSDDWADIGAKAKAIAPNHHLHQSIFDDLASGREPNELV